MEYSEIISTSRNGLCHHSYSDFMQVQFYMKIVLQLNSYLLHFSIIMDYLRHCLRVAC